MEKKKENCIYYQPSTDLQMQKQDYGYCSRCIPDSYFDCKGVCCFYKEEQNMNQEWENVMGKGAVDTFFEECNKIYQIDEEGKTEKESVVIEGVGKDAEIVVNEKGGKQSKSPMAAHLIDPTIILNYDCEVKIYYIFQFMSSNDKYYLIKAMEELEPNFYERCVRIAKVLKEGAEKYEANNWRLIPQEEHINHALIHLFAAELGDTQDNHIDHALTRLMMAYATEKSQDFSYTEYVKKKEQ